MSRLSSLPVLALAAALFAACGGGADSTGSSEGGAPSIVVTTNILGDVVSSIVGDSAEISVVMPVGSSPHDFQASAQEAAAIRSADLLVVNGGGFEEGLLDVIEGAERDGVPVVEALAAVDGLEAEGDHGDAADPHFFTDPVRMSAAVERIAEAVVDEVPDIDAEAVRQLTEEYVAELDELHRDIESELSAIPVEERVLVTNHEVFGYFADRYGFEVVGTVIPGGSTSDAGSGRALADLVQVVRERDVAAVFADTSSPDELARTLAAEVGDVEVVELFSESLGEPGSGAATYLEMMRTNARLIVEALT